MLLKIARNIFFSIPIFSVAMVLLQQTAIAGGNPEEGKKIYENICISCHGEGGRPELPGIPVFADGERMDKTDEQLMKSVKNGVSDPNNPAGQSMPPFGGGPQLNDKQISDVLSYIRTLKK